ncbi:hypothetical protein [Escherichia phage ZCEC12]|uniref:hypothetical protein n=1 Tax=Escherichia phage ZCEC10 TaxID=2894588 RepID=UPI00240D7473|nr:hypothetical protein P9622_gp28 [Escherichia phage ZCEC10]UJQ87920.1 hypothetical protein [Escherichia phage ZCEC12]UJQ88030.1 hypothetical protein [Escherichia phage ZCEC10]
MGLWQSGPPARLHASNIISDKNNRKIRLQSSYWLHILVAHQQRYEGKQND